MLSLDPILRKMKTLPSKLLQGHIYFFRYAIERQKGRKNSSVCFLDLDGTLWPDKSPNQIMSIMRPSKEVSLALDYLKNRFDFVIAISNQTLHAKSTHFNFVNLVQYFSKLLLIRTRFRLDGFLICHHHRDAANTNLKSSCPYRKPFQKMIAEVELVVPLDRSKSVIVGDRLSDVVVGNACNFRQTYLIVEEYSLDKIVSEISWPEVYIFTPIRSISEVIDFEMRI